jgi:hypothetical protein
MRRKKVEMKANHLFGKLIFLGLVLVILLILARATITFASGTGSASYWRIFSGGGGSASGDSVTLDSTLGQPVTGVSSSGSAWLGAGYWYAEQPVQLFLPLLRR